MWDRTQHSLHLLSQFLLFEFLQFCLGRLRLDPHDATAPPLADLFKALIVVGLDSLYQVVECSLVFTGQGERRGRGSLKIHTQVVTYFLIPARQTAVAVFLCTNLPSLALLLTMQ